MKRHPRTRFALAVCVLFALRIEWAYAQQQFQGSVWEGSAVHTYTTPLSGVTVSLYGSNNSGSLGTLIESATTSSTGQYALSIPRIPHEYYNIVETDPSGYTSVGATTVSGTVIGSNQIQYTSTTGTLTGNKFWDEEPDAQILNRPPIAEAGGPYACNAGSSIAFDGSGSYDPDPGDSIVRNEWDLDNDGTYDETGVTWTKTYPAAGSGTVRLRVTDTQGEQATDTATYTVSEDQQSAGAIYGAKFNDLNGNGVWDTGETGLAGWLISLRGTSDADPLIPVVGTATTDKNGKYSFPTLDPGTYTISETSQSGWTQTCPPSPGTYTVTLTPGQAVSSLDFGNTQSTMQGNLDYGDAPSPYPEASAELGGPWLDGPSDPPDAEGGMQRNADATGDDNSGADDERGVFQMTAWASGSINWVEVMLYNPDPNKNVIACTWVDWNCDKIWSADEKIFSENCKPATFTFKKIFFNIPQNAKIGITFMRSRICYENDPWNENTMSSSGSSGPGEVEDREVIVGGTGTPPLPGNLIVGEKWNDSDGDGLYEATEKWFENCPIWLDMNGNGKYDPGIDKVEQTDFWGDAFFWGIPDGTYVMGEILPPGWVQTYPGGNGTYTVTVKFSLGFTFSGSLGLFGNHQTRTVGGGEGALKWYQPPLRHPEKQEERCYYGWGELSMDGSVNIADDWFCYSPRPVTSITWWGSYAGWDSLAPPPNAPQKFHVGVWSDVPKGKDRDWSRPGKLIQAWVVDRSQLDEKSDKCNRIPEWMQKPDSSFQYTYSIPKADQFVQEGDSTVYWLSIAAVYQEPPKDHVWGWLTRERYFNDAPVRIYAPAEIRPDSLFRIGETLPENWDMAFVLGTDQNTGIFDFGDATDELNTTLSHNGALHLIRHDVRMGETVDAEDDGQPDPQAQGDDKNGSADEDGVAFLSDLVPGKMAKAAVSVTARGFLNAWLDLNGNGKWEPREHVINNLELSAGNHALDFPVADDAVPGERIARFRFSTMPGVWVKGFAIDGEVEDYGVVIGKTTDVKEKKDGTRLDQFRLYPNYPNPFNPSTTIRFNLPKAMHVRLSIYNLLGQEIVVLVDEKLSAGLHDLRWEGRDKQDAIVPSGVYVYRLEAGSYRGIGKLLFLK